MLVFFDDILVYSPTLESHVEHLKEVFEVLRKNTLFVKKEKSSFAQNKVEYLGHVITEEGVAADERKIEAMSQSPSPRTIKVLRGFLGLPSPQKPNASRKANCINSERIRETNTLNNAFSIRIINPCFHKN